MVAIGCQKLLNCEVKEAMCDSSASVNEEIGRGLHETQGVQTPVQSIRISKRDLNTFFNNFVRLMYAS